MVLPLFQKCLFFTNLGQGLSQKVGFFQFLSHFYELDFQTKCWLSQMRNLPLSLFQVASLLAVVFAQFCPNII